MDLDIAGNVALTTASSDGLGNAAATALVRDGGSVVINGSDEDRLEAAAEVLREEVTGDGGVQGGEGEGKGEEEVVGLVEETLDEFGRLDHLVTSAGGPPSGPFLGTDDDDWYHAYDLLVMSVVRLCRAAAEPLQADGGGTIVNITSRSVKEAIDGLVLSNAVRMSVIGLEKTLATELGPDVRVNAVLPGPHETSRIEDLVEQAVYRRQSAPSADGLAAYRHGTPTARIGAPKPLPRPPHFLTPPEADLTTQQSTLVATAPRND